MRLLLDTNILRMLCHPKKYRDVKDWFQQWLNRGAAGEAVEIQISAAADYELRRGYLWKLDKHPHERKALDRLNALCHLLGVQPLQNNSLREAAQLWADARLGGYPTAADRDVDWDVIIASQAREQPAVVVTENVKHLARYHIDARNWHELPAPA